MGKLTFFDWAMFNSKLLVYQRVDHSPGFLMDFHKLCFVKTASGSWILQYLQHHLYKLLFFKCFLINMDPSVKYFRDLKPPMGFIAIKLSHTFFLLLVHPSPNLNLQKNINIIYIYIWAMSSAMFNYWKVLPMNIPILLVKSQHQMPQKSVVPCFVHVRNSSPHPIHPSESPLIP